ncbi:hypothetical protein [Escherichia marmotae]|uniref:hypothetical protein n=1 Tax=Escherichia marmotae TaxID=1499973 RepID=UPI003D961D88
MNQMDLSDLKEMIEGVLEIVSWNPTLAQLEQMQIELSKLPEGATRKEVSLGCYVVIPGCCRYFTGLIFRGRDCLAR